jgi:hypothetical protein
MIGYYVHHVGAGHAHRAAAIAANVGVGVTGLSSLPRPDDWNGDWITLPRDDIDPTPDSVTAGGRLHWAPLHDAGLRNRMAIISSWITRAAPSVMVVDVSVEVALLARLHGVPVATFMLPGSRGDAAHSLGYDTASLILAAWPDGVADPVTGFRAANLHKVRRVGAISRFPISAERQAGGAPKRVALLAGRGGSSLTREMVDRASAQTPDWQWTVLGGPDAEWVDDPWPIIRSADVVVTHAGESALAEVSAARRPAVVIPERRPHGEQLATARTLRRSEHLPALVLPSYLSTEWNRVLTMAGGLDGYRWSAWNDGQGAARAAESIRELADSGRK